MEIIHFNQRNLAQRWNVSEATLERWRSEGIGPMFLKLQVEYSRTSNRLSSTMPKRPHRSPYRRAEQGHWYGPLMRADFPVRRRASSQLRE